MRSGRTVTAARQRIAFGEVVEIERVVVVGRRLELQRYVAAASASKRSGGPSHAMRA